MRYAGNTGEGHRITHKTRVCQNTMGELTMRSWIQKLLFCKKYFIPVFSFLFLFTMSWLVWVWLIPPQPRAIITPLTDSKFIAFTPDSRFLITREPQWCSRARAKSAQEEPFPIPGSIWDVCSCPSRIQVWDARNGTLVHTFGGEWADMEEVIPAPDSQHLIGWMNGDPGKSPDLILMSDLPSAENSKRVTTLAKERSFVRLTVSRDEKWLIVEPRSGVMYQCWLWRIGSDNLVRFDRTGPTITFSEDGEYVVTSGDEFEVNAWRLDDLRRPWMEHRWSADGGVVFPGGRTAATYRVENFQIAAVKLWDLTSGQLLANFPAGDRREHIRFFNFPPGNRIFTHYVDGAASTAIWDVSGQPKLISILHGWQIVTSEDRTWMLQSEKTGVHLVNLRSGKELSLTHNTDTQPSSNDARGKFSPDSRMVAVTEIYRNVNVNSNLKQFYSFLWIKLPKESGPVARLWAVETGAEIAQFDDSTEVLFSPDSKSLATLQQDGTMHLWDLPTRTVFWKAVSWAAALWLLLILGCLAWGRLRKIKLKRPT